MKRFSVFILFLGVFAIACSIFTGGSPTATPTVPPPVDTSTPPPVVETPTPSQVVSGPCMLTAEAEVTIYQRPSLEADVFSTQPAGFTTEFTARTADGWLGFDPGVAQAANIGSFRLRWVPESEPGVSGDCGSLPVVWGPPPGICFDMPMEDVNVYAAPDTGSEVLAELHVEEFAAVVGTNGADWAKVDLGPGNTGSTVVGWVESTTLNMNGPCESLPPVSP